MISIEAVVLVLVTIPILYLAHWGINNDKIGQYKLSWLEFRKKWEKKHVDLQGIIRKKASESSSNLSEVPFARSMTKRVSIEGRITPL